MVNLLEEHQLSSDYMRGDETRMKVLKEPGMSPTSHKQMWIMRGGPPGQMSVLFHYDKSRAKFEGRYFQSDGYAAYDAICEAEGIIHLGCWDHARRKFVEVVRAAPKPNSKNKAKKNTPPSKAQVALSMINALYAVEREIKERSDEEGWNIARHTVSPSLRSSMNG